MGDVGPGDDLEESIEVPTDVLRESEQLADHQEGAAIAQALLLSKMEMHHNKQDCDEVVLLRFTNNSEQVQKVLLESSDLAACRTAVQEAGLDVAPSWANGAKILAPVTRSDVPLEESNMLKAHN